MRSPGSPTARTSPQHVTGAIGRAQRSGQGMAVVYLDLDDFKVVNDTLGHAVGDRLLVEVARPATRHACGSATLPRASAATSSTSCSRAWPTRSTPTTSSERILERPVRAVPARPRTRSGSGLRLGIAGLGDADLTAEDLQRHADAALYEAKADGKSRQAWFDPAMGARAWARLELEHGLRRALEQGEIELAYQPRRRPARPASSAASRPWRAGGTRSAA